MVSTVRHLENEHNKSVLKLDQFGKPVEWISVERAIEYAFKDKIISMDGNKKFTYHSSGNSLTGENVILTVTNIITVKTDERQHRAKSPNITNYGLYKRDNFFCGYCGQHFNYSELTRDHVVSQRMFGANTWDNCVACCKRCNDRKGDRLPGRRGAPNLLFEPYTPTLYDYLYFTHRSADPEQIEYLSKFTDIDFQKERLSHLTK